MQANRFITISTLIIWMFAVAHCWAECIPHLVVDHSKHSSSSTDHHHHHSHDSDEHDHSQPTTPCEVSSAIITDKFSTISTYNLDLSIQIHPTIEAINIDTKNLNITKSKFDFSKDSSVRITILTAPNPPPLNVI